MVGNNLQVLDPVFSTSYASRVLGYLAYDTLIAKDSHGNYKPQMLESWVVSPDQTTYTFKLRPGQTWHDGSPVRARDCVASLQRWEERDGLGGRLKAVSASLQAEDDLTFSLKLAKPFGLVIDALAKESSIVPFMMPERLANTPATQALTEVDGSGPFIFKADEFVQGSQAVFVKNPNYKPRPEPADGLAGGKVVRVDRVVLRSLNDAATQVSALTNGEIEFLQYVPFDLMPVLQNNSSIVIANPGVNASNIGVLRFNHLQPPFDNEKVRKAFETAINRADALAAIGGTGQFVDAKCVSLFGCGGPYAATKGGEDVVTYNLNKAKSLLKDSGYRGEKILLLVVNGPVETLAAPAVRNSLAQAGFNVDTQIVELETLFQRRTSKAPLTEGGWSAFITYLGAIDVGSPVTHLYINNNCNPNYPGWSCDEEIKRLIDAFAAEPDFAKRKALASEVNVHAHISLPAALWGQFTTPMAFSNKLKGVIIDTPTPVFWNITE